MESTLIDRHQLETFIAIGFADYHELLADVIRDSPAYLDAIRDAIRDGDLEKLKTKTHSLRGMISFFGCIGMTSKLARLGECSSVAPDRAAAIHAELLSLWEASLAAIEEWETCVPEFAS